MQVRAITCGPESVTAAAGAGTPRKILPRFGANNRDLPRIGGIWEGENWREREGDVGQGLIGLYATIG